MPLMLKVLYIMKILIILMIVMMKISIIDYVSQHTYGFTGKDINIIPAFGKTQYSSIQTVIIL